MLYHATVCMLLFILLDILFFTVSLICECMYEYVYNVSCPEAE